MSSGFSADRLLKVFRSARVVTARESRPSPARCRQRGIGHQADGLVKVVECLLLAALKQGDLAQPDVSVVDHGRSRADALRIQPQGSLEFPGGALQISFLELQVHTVGDMHLRGVGRYGERVV